MSHSLMTNFVASGSRLADFFVSVGLPEDFVLSSLLRLPGEQAQDSSKLYPPPSPSLERTSSNSSSKSSLKYAIPASIESFIFPAVVTDKYGDDLNSSLPEGLELFAFPNGACS